MFRAAARLARFEPVDPSLSPSSSSYADLEDSSLLDFLLEPPVTSDSGDEIVFYLAFYYLAASSSSSVEAYSSLSVSVRSSSRSMPSRASAKSSSQSSSLRKHLPSLLANYLVYSRVNFRSLEDTGAPCGISISGCMLIRMLILSGLERASSSAFTKLPSKLWPGAPFNLEGYVSVTFI